MDTKRYVRRFLKYVQKISRDFVHILFTNLNIFLKKSYFLPRSVSFVFFTAKFTFRSRSLMSSSLPIKKEKALYNMKYKKLKRKKFF